jgi:hypothetical protein
MKEFDCPPDSRVFMTPCKPCGRRHYAYLVECPHCSAENVRWACLGVRAACPGHKTTCWKCKQPLSFADDVARAMAEFRASRTPEQHKALCAALDAAVEAFAPDDCDRPSLDRENNEE